MIKLNTNFAIDHKLFKNYMNKVKKLHESIIQKTGKGAKYFGWMDLPNNYNNLEYKNMKIKAKFLQNKIDYLIVIGIGGSYLGSRGAIDMIDGLYNKNQKVKIIYAGHTTSSTYIKQLLDFLANKKFGICVISKSGNTIETAIAFRYLENLLIKNMHEKAKELIICITDKTNGKLIELANKKNYEKYIIPNDISGWHPVLTPVGIFPMLVAGINTDEIFAGAKLAKIDLKKSWNTAYEYALTRFILYTKNKYKVELLISYELQMQYFTQWWKELFGESEGKENKGLLPLTSIFSTDLHSLGQFIQEGSKILFETIIKIKEPTNDIKMTSSSDNTDGLNYLNGKTLNEINYVAFKGVLEAHNKTAKVPNIIIEFSKMNAKTFGYAVYWFFQASTMSAYLLNLNPNELDDAGIKGVKVYKENISKLLK